MKNENKMTIEQYHAILDSEPSPSHIKTRETFDYLPIEVIDGYLRKLYGDYQTKNMRVINVANELVVTVELVVTHPVTGKELVSSGIAANPILQNAKTSIKDFSSQKKKNALEYGAPATLSSAIANAAAKIGNLFGQNVGRKDAANSYSFRRINTETKSKESEQKENK